MGKHKTAKKWIRTKADKAAVKLGCYFDEGAAKEVVLFFESGLVHSKGRWAGKPFILSKWERDDIIEPIFGWKRPDGTRRYRTAYIEVAKKNGKALALDTLIPTPQGWTDMGLLDVGDQVFDENGLPCNVIATTEIMKDRPCYRVRMWDGEEIVADADHQWCTNARTLRGKARLWTTGEIARSVRIDTPGSAGSNHSIPVAGALQLEEKDLPIAPYVLGAWLGDGHSDSGRLTCGYADFAIVEEIRRSGVRAEERRSPDLNSGLYALDSFPCHSREALHDSLAARLRRLHLLGHKFIPAIYQRASYSQRLALLRGLMDTDGHCTKSGQCEFVTIREELRDDVVQLIWSLGFKATSVTDRARIDGRDCGPRHRIQFHPYADVPVFTLERKRMRQKPRPDRLPRSTTRQILSVEACESVPVRCIQVDSPSGLFLAGRTMVATHNSTIGAGIGIYMLVGDGEQGSHVFSVATKRDQAAIVHDEAVRMCKASPHLYPLVTINQTTNTVADVGTNSKYAAAASEANGLEGLDWHTVIADEMHAWKDRKVWDTLEHGGAARSQPLMFIITTAGVSDITTIGWQMHEYAAKVLSGEFEDPDFFAYIRTAPMDLAMDDPKAHAAANPALGDTIDPAEIMAAAKRAKNRPGAENVFRRYRLNQWVAQTERWLSVEEWDACGVEVAPISLAGRPCYGGLDLASSRDIAAFVLWFPPTEDEPGYLLPRFWVPEESARNRQEENNLVMYQTWGQQGFITLTHGNTIDYESIKAQILRDNGQYDIREIGADKWQLEFLRQQLEAEGSAAFTPFQMIMHELSAPAKRFEELIVSRRLQHNKNPVMRWMIGNVSIYIGPNEDIRPDKKHSTEKIDGISAAVIAIGRSMVSETGSVYDTRGLIII